MRKKVTITAVVIALTLGIGSAVAASQPPVKNKQCVIITGASYASSHWPTVTMGGTPTPDSNAPVLGGRYVGICDALSAFKGLMKVSCPAVAGAMSQDIALPYGPLVISAPGLMTQFEQGKTECGGKPDALVIMLVNDGPAAIVPTMNVIDAAKAANISPDKIIVQAYPRGKPDFQREYNTALQMEGNFWGSVLQAVSVPPTAEQYFMLVAAQRQALESYEGSTFVDLYPGLYLNAKTIDRGTYDGVHPKYGSQIPAVEKLFYLLSK